VTHARSSPRAFALRTSSVRPEPDHDRPSARSRAWTRAPGSTPCSADTDARELGGARPPGAFARSSLVRGAALGGPCGHSISEWRSCGRTISLQNERRHYRACRRSGTSRLKPRGRLVAVGRARWAGEAASAAERPGPSSTRAVAQSSWPAGAADRGRCGSFAGHRVAHRRGALCREHCRGEPRARGGLA
jgi:hypothetical protein